MMNLFGPSKRELTARLNALETRSSLENPSVSLTSAQAWADIFGTWTSATGVSVTPDKAMGVATFWAAVNFLSATIASVPLYMFNVTESGPERARNNPLEAVLNEAPNEGMSSFRWRQLCMASILMHGRSYSYLELNKAGRVMNIWPLEYGKMTVERKDGRLRYTYRDDGRQVVYAWNEIIDVIWMPKTDGIGHYEPVNTLKNVIGLSISLEEYASKFFQNGGVPPLQLVGPMNSPGAISRAQIDIMEALKAAKAENRPILPMPLMHELKQIGFDPEKGQLTEARRFQLEEMARVFDLPPVFLQDLTHGTFSNSEQQDLHLVKHTIRQWFRRWEDELNLKLVSRRNRKTRIRFDEDELLRGDFQTRMTGYAAGVQAGLIKPDDGREAMGWTRVGGAADNLFMQGAMMPIEKLGAEPVPVSQPQEPNADDNAT